MRRVGAWLAAGVGVAWLTAASALGLGEIDVISKLNQKFLATIPISSVPTEELDGLLVTLASNEEFTRAGIERPEYLSTLRFAVRADGGGPRIVISSQQAAHEPYLNFLLDVRGKTSRVLREYTVLLDPPNLAAPAASATPLAPPRPVAGPTDFYETPEEAARRAAPPLPQSMPPTSMPVRSKPAAASPPAYAPPPAPIPAYVPPPPPSPEPSYPVFSSPAPTLPGGERYGPVRPGETLWSIAAKLRPDVTVSMDQVQLALYRRNPKMFDGFNGLHKDAVLEVPGADQMRATSPPAAKSELAQLRGLRTSTVAPPKKRSAKTLPAASMTAPEPASAAASAPAPAQVSPPPLATIAPTPPPVAKEPSAAPQPASSPTASTSAPAATPATSPTAAPPTPTPSPTGETSAAPAPAVEGVPAIITQESPPPAAAPPVVVVTESTDTSSPLLWWLVGLALLAGLAAAGFTYWNKRGRPGSAMPRALAPTTAPMEELPPRRTPGGGLGSLADRNTARPLQSDETQRFDAPPLAATAQMPATDYNATWVPPTSTTASFQPELAPEDTADKVDFDVTSQFAADTMSINLDANDPLSEADFHLAYGLYDEAALLLKQAAEREPGRTDLRVKLAETYFAASRPDNFVEVAESLKGRVTDAEWQKIAIMGRQLSPAAEIFEDSDGAGQTINLGSDFDLSSFDEPAAQPPPAASNGDADGVALDFKLEDLELPKQDDASFDAPAAGGHELDFQLDDVGAQSAKMNATQPGRPAMMESFADIDPAEFDITSAFTTGPGKVKRRDPAQVQLDDFDLDDASTSMTGGDEASTKLDLARAYADMGDNEMARTLLKEVLAQGNAGQQREAQTLIGKLAA